MNKNWLRAVVFMALGIGFLITTGYSIHEGWFMPEKTRDYRSSTDERPFSLWIEIVTWGFLGLTSLICGFKALIQSKKIKQIKFHKNNNRLNVQEQQQLQESFAPILKRYRRFASWTAVFLAFFFAAIGTGFFLPKNLIGWSVGAGLIFWLAAVITVIAGNFPKCPACHADLNSRELGSFCPECGSANLKLGGWLKAANCDACGKSLRRGKSRQFTIRACTHCGVFLDEKGF